MFIKILEAIKFVKLLKLIYSLSSNFRNLNKY